MWPRAVLETMHLLFYLLSLLRWAVHTLCQDNCALLTKTYSWHSTTFSKITLASGFNNQIIASFCAFFYFFITLFLAIYQQTKRNLIKQRFIGQLSQIFPAHATPSSNLDPVGGHELSFKRSPIWKSSPSSLFKKNGLSLKGVEHNASYLKLGLKRPSLRVWVKLYVCCIQFRGNMNYSLFTGDQWIERHKSQLPTWTFTKPSWCKLIIALISLNQSVWNANFSLSLP